MSTLCLRIDHNLVVVSAKRNFAKQPNIKILYIQAHHLNTEFGERCANVVILKQILNMRITVDEELKSVIDGVSGKMDLLVLSALLKIWAYDHLLNYR